MKLDNQPDAPLLYKCLNKLLVNTQDEVTACQFGKILDFFGPLRRNLEGDFFSHNKKYAPAELVSW